jgi:hypothetical protein
MVNFCVQNEFFSSCSTNAVLNIAKNVTIEINNIYKQKNSALFVVPFGRLK